jgi:hypothetical protein
MNFKSLRYGMAVAVAMAGISGFVGSAQAQTPVLTNITTSSSVTVADVADLEFGTWFLVYRNADAFELTMTTTGTITANNIAAGPGNSVALSLVAGAGEGSVTVDLPAGANGVVLNMQRTAIVDFLDGTLPLQNTTSGTTTQGENQAMATAVNVPVTVVTGGTPEEVRFGGEIAVTGQPADGAHSASYNVSFAF